MSCRRFFRVERQAACRGRLPAKKRRVPRPGHADYVANMKFHGAQDVSGGGHFSGRLTAPLCIAGGIAIQLLRDEGVEVGAHIARIAGIADDAFALHGLSSTDVHVAHAKTFPVLNDAQGERMIAAIAEAREAGDSVGGVVECAATGMRRGRANVRRGRECRRPHAVRHSRREGR